MISPVVRVGELAEHPHVKSREGIRQERDSLGNVALVAPPFRLASWRPRHEAAPAEGEHTVQILGVVANEKRAETAHIEADGTTR